MLRGARLAIATETQEGRRWDDAKVKQLTGGDRIVARHMRQDWFEFEPTFKLIVVGNHAPQIATVDDAMRRRLCMVPFNNKPSMPDAGLSAALRGEAPGILQWAMEGFEAYRAAGGLNPPERVLKATKAYLDEQDTVGAWLEDCCEVGQGGWTASADLFRSWSQWCQDAGMHAKSMKRLAGDLARKGIVAERRRMGRGFANVRVTLGDASVTHRQSGYLP
jgi:putative DNA primase/helicase